MTAVQVPGRKLIDGWERLAIDLTSNYDPLNLTDEERYRWRRWITDHIHTTRLRTDPDPQYRLLVELGLSGAVKPVLRPIERTSDAFQDLAIQHLKWLHYINEWLAPSQRPRLNLPALP